MATAREGDGLAASAFELAHVAMCMLDEEGSLIAANPALCELVGREREELLQAHVSDLMSHDRTRTRHRFQQAMENPGDAVSFDRKVRRRDNTDAEVQIHMRADGEGHVLCELYDISTWFDKTNRMRHAVDLYEMLIQGLSMLGEGMLVSEERTVVYANTCLARLLGVRREQLEGEPWPPEIFSEQLKEWAVPKRRPSRDRELPSRRYISVFTSRDGVPRELEASVGALRYGGRTVHVAVFRDISERRHSSRSRAHLASIVQSSADAMLSVSPEGKILTWNPGAELMLGLSSDDAVGRRLTDLALPVAQADLAVLIDQVLEGGTVQQFQTRFMRADGRPIDVSITMSPIAEVTSDEVANISILARDVTERRRDHERLAAYAARLETVNEQLRDADRIKDDFVAMASHELRTPLTSISGFSSTMIDMWDDLGDREKRAYLHVIDDQAQRLTRVVNDILVVSRIESGRLTRVPRRIEVAEAIEDALRQFRTVDVAVSCERGLAAWMDPDHLQQIILNYVSNAVKYGEPPITIRAWSERRGGASCCVLRVCDCGPGVPDDFVPRLFEKFAQASTGSTRSAEGSGLGLSIVKALAESEGGSVWYEPNEPRGACFVVRVPLA